MTDCLLSLSGLVLESFNTFARQRDCEMLTEVSDPVATASEAHLSHSVYVG